MGVGDYEVRESIGSEVELAAVAWRLAVDRAREQAREAEEEALAAEQAARRREDETRRPYAERLLALRCNACHAAAYFDDKIYGWIGWNGVILRIVYLNGAELATNERQILVDHLLNLRSPDRTQIVMEYVAAVGFLVLLPVAIGVAAYRRCKRHCVPPTPRR